mmetsp:Transcript_62186/g.157055  ORF Transcript_62186/g.157055 Transcript_62186/m.157055 type:complete len:531 (-) Transcript_62186:114-1706(-)
MVSLMRAGAFLALVWATMGQRPMHFRQLLEQQATTHAAKCDGEAVQAKTAPLGECALYEGALASTIAKCNASSLLLYFFNGTACKGRSTFTLAMPVGQCYKSPLARGMSITISCDGGNYTQVSWSSAPPAPHGAICEDTGVASVAAGTLSVRSSEVNASLVDQVSFEVSLPPLDRPFVGFTAPVGRDGVARAMIPGLRPATKYAISVRAHRRGKQEGDPEAWSAVSAANTTCLSVGASAASPKIPMEPEAAPAKQKVATRWLEVYRFATAAKLPDFLDQHNAGDLVAEFAMLGQLKSVPNLPLTRYCVEILDTLLPNITTGKMDGEPIQSNFADFASCMQGQCMCTHQVDRSIAHLPAKQIQDMCSGPPMGWSNNTCRCSEQSTEQSGRYVGRLIIPLPLASEAGWIKAPFTIPPEYPHPVRPSPTGYWYSFPYLGRCPLGAAVGDQGCTWRRSPVSHTVFSDELVGLDGNMTIDVKNMRWNIPFEASLTNILAGERAFRRLPADVPTCGEQADLDRREGFSHPPQQIVV